MMEAEYYMKVEKNIFPNCGGMEIFYKILEGCIIRPTNECGDIFQYNNPTLFVLRRF